MGRWQDVFLFKKHEASRKKRGKTHNSIKVQRRISPGGAPNRAVRGSILQDYSKQMLTPALRNYTNRPLLPVFRRCISYPPILSHAHVYIVLAVWPIYSPLELHAIGLQQ